MKKTRKKKNKKKKTPTLRKEKKTSEDGDEEELNEDVNDKEEVFKKSNSTTIFRTIFFSLLCIYYTFMKYLLNLFQDLMYLDIFISSERLQKRPSLASDRLMPKAHNTFLSTHWTYLSREEPVLAVCHLHD